jgi:hypothetical protein
MPDDIRGYMDKADKDMLKSYLMSLSHAAEGTNFGIAVEAACLSLRSTGQLRKTDMAMYATRLYLGEAPAYEDPVDLSGYDAVFSEKGVIYE